MNTMFRILRFLTYPYRLLRGYLFPLSPKDSGRRFNRIMDRFRDQDRGGRIAFDRGGYAYEVGDGISRQRGEVEIDHKHNPCCAHLGIDYEDTSYVMGSTSWLGKRPPRATDSSRLVKRLLGPAMARRLRTNG